MLKLVETEQFDDNTTVTRYDCNETVQCNGTSLWGDTAGRKVHITHIDVIEEADFDYTSVNVTHDSTWDIYTDKAFEAAVSKLLGFAVFFTEQGMQDDAYASMEC